MLRATLPTILGALIVSVSCSKSERGDAVGSAAPSGAGSAVKAGSGSTGGGFSADLAKELGAGSAAKSGSDAPRAGSAPSAGSVAAATGGDAPSAGTAVAKTGPVVAVATAGNGGKPEPATKAGNAAKTDGAKAGNAAKTDGAKAGDAAKAMKDGAGAARARDAASAGVREPGAPPGGPASTSGSAPAPRGPATVPTELAAIKLSLLPNWDRDIDRAGTFQYVVRIKGTQSTKTFSFRYGYDDPKAPTDREQYKKYLQDSKTLMGEIRDRQRGSAWFLEGTDVSGLPAFRYVVLYGGKRLICYGSLYKDADSNRLGDDRDQTVIQAKQICETLAL